MNKSQSFQKNKKICSLSKRPFGLYIHWPFCHAKCPYCDFNSHVKTNVDEKIINNSSTFVKKFVKTFSTDNLGGPVGRYVSLGGVKVETTEPAEIEGAALRSSSYKKKEKPQQSHTGVIRNREHPATRSGNYLTNFFRQHQKMTPHSA
mgnify:CR=1 FL=1